mgnify:CR=1 FL=1
MKINIEIIIKKQIRWLPIELIKITSNRIPYTKANK